MPVDIRLYRVENPILEHEQLLFQFFPLVCEHLHLPGLKLVHPSGVYATEPGSWPG